MDVQDYSEAGLRRAIKKLFGKIPTFQREGKYVHVHLDEADEDKQLQRVQTFVPEAFFDRDCPC